MASGTNAFVFNRRKLEDDWQDTLKTLDLMSHYPKVWWLLDRVRSQDRLLGAL